MLLIPCPYCGPRAEIEFKFGRAFGPAVDGVKPDEAGMTPELPSWARANTKGVQWESWLHRHGCRQWFVVQRDTVSHDFKGQAIPLTHLDASSEQDRG